MKITNKLSRRHLYIGLCVATIIAGGSWLYHTHQTNQSEDMTLQTNGESTRESNNRHVEEKELDKTRPAPSPKSDSLSITLPGATPIPARRANYTDDADIWRITNKTHGFHNPRYIPPDLTVVGVATKPGRGRDERSVRAVIISDLTAMMQAAERDGAPLQVGSGYRSYATQTVLFDSYARQHGEAEAARFSSRPGHSEHQSGLAVDFDAPGGACWVENCFANTAQGKWLKAHAHQYGFILRYPEGKEAVTGYSYESWYFRYVGKELAGALQQSGLTLEEAAPYLQRAQAAAEKAGGDA
ncbi:MAG: M15 family metallopeptidase [Candidatus Saccharibacteria bacterium]|nr:M15 family metallopeptidase [Candidatus Saccharibacteria bacterium]